MAEEISYLGIPHTRGDEPQQRHPQNRHQKVFPTRVGMNRGGVDRLQRAGSIPHTRGDEPMGGWLAELLATVFPTRVGMNLLPLGYSGSCAPYSPHAWG